MILHGHWHPGQVVLWAGPLCWPVHHRPYQLRRRRPAQRTCATSLPAHTAASISLLGARHASSCSTSIQRHTCSLVFAAYSPLAGTPPKPYPSLPAQAAKCTLSFPCYLNMHQHKHASALDTTALLHESEHFPYAVCRTLRPDWSSTQGGSSPKTEAHG
jgi:hypothetical protein